MSAHILLIEDDYALAEGLHFLLTREGFQVDAALDGQEGLRQAEQGAYQLIICDRMLPGMDGVDILKTLRARGNTTKLLFLTARDTTQEKVEGLNYGADDYITKPFETEELLARIRVLLRRPEDSDTPSSSCFADLELGPDDNVLLCGKNSEILTPKERQMMALFLQTPGQVLNRKYILEEVWGTSSFIEENNIDICVHHLRKKLSALGSNAIIRTVRGVGYTLDT